MKGNTGICQQAGNLGSPLMAAVSEGIGLKMGVLIDFLHGKL
jgi:hypothetical protein